MSVSILSRGPTGAQGGPRVLKKSEKEEQPGEEVLAAGRWGGPWCPSRREVIRTETQTAALVSRPLWRP